MEWRALAVLAALLAAGCASPDPAPQALPAEDPAEPTLTAVDAPAESVALAQGRDDRLTPGLYTLELLVGGELATGLVAVPHGQPQAIVVIAHGWGGEADSHRADLDGLADDGAIAVAMDFRGERGAFKVRAGVEDTLAATTLLQERYPGLLTMVYGWSMGGEVALLAALQAPPGTFDYVFASAGVMDLALFWHEAPLARAAIEAEAGGTPADVPDAYAARSPLQRVGELADSGVRRVFLVHGAGDWIVPVEHAERMYQALADAGQPVSYYAATKDRTAVCVGKACLLTPAGHDAGRFELVQPLVEHRIDGLPDPDQPSVRGTYDAHTGEYDPSDVG